MMTFLLLGENTMITFLLLGFENLKFCETEHRLSVFQVSDLLVVSIKFYRG